MPRRARWPRRLSPVTAAVDCNGESHRVTWKRGRLVLEDHDLAAETALLAFGGQPFPCLDVLRRWRDLHSWAMSSQVLRQMEARMGPGAAVVPRELAPVHELGLLRTWERRWRRSGYYSDHERLLGEQFRKRATQPLRDHLAHWKQRGGARLLSPPTIEVLRPGQPPTMRGTMNRVKVTAIAALNTTWVLEVWARGLALVDHAFVLEVVPQLPGRRLTVKAVRWQEHFGGTWSPVTATAQVSFDPTGLPHLGWEEPASPPGRLV